MRRLLSIAAGVWLSFTAPAMAQPAAATAHIVLATNNFLSSLDAQQRSRVLYAFDDKEQRTRWSNFPTVVVARGGISIKEMTTAQREAAMAVLASALSPRGLEKVRQIMEGDEINKLTDKGPRGGRGGLPPPGGKDDGMRPAGPNRAPGNPDGPGRPSFGSGPIFGRDLYYISVLGTPSEKDPWMLQFGGHHLALNITIAGDRGVLTPTLTGAQPALYTSNGKTVRPLGQESDKGFALLQALDEKQRKQAILSYRLADLVLGPGQDGKTIVPEGLKASSMTGQQRTLLLDLMREWAGIMNESATADRMAELEADLDQTWFAWSGPVTAKPGSNISAYYRIQGPHVVIEYAPQGQGDDPSLHVHTMYRDPTNDYGVRFTAAR